MKSSYNSVLRRLLCIPMPYSGSKMFVSCSISSFYELLRKGIIDFYERNNRNTYSIIDTCLSPNELYDFPHQTIILTINHFMLIILWLFPKTSSLIFNFPCPIFVPVFKFFYVCIWTVVSNKGFLLYIIKHLAI